MAAKDGPRAFIFDGLKTLPLYVLMARVEEDIPAFGSGRATIALRDPNYERVTYSASSEYLQKIGSDAALAAMAVKDWPDHLAKYLYFIQLRDDSDHLRIKALHDHTELISVLCDGRLQIDTGALWYTFDQLHGVELVHSEYRQDPKRDETYGEYSERLDAAMKRLGERQMEALRLVQRIGKQLELKAADWRRMSAFSQPKQPQHSIDGIKLFCSYSHKDEMLRDELGAHLSLLKRQNIIDEWHDRRILAGQELDKEIDRSLETARLILLLVSADFVNSDYCWGIEVARAMERHEARTAIVIPVILRACDWQSAPFGNIKALPRDGKPVTSWLNKDEAFADVAREIREAVTLFQQMPQTSTEQ